MTGQSAVPPPYVWDRIEKILDEQDKAKKQTEQLISDTFRERKNRQQNFFLLLIATVSLIALVIMNYDKSFKQG